MDAQRSFRTGRAGFRELKWLCQGACSKYLQSWGFTSSPPGSHHTAVPSRPCSLFPFSIPFFHVPPEEEALPTVSPSLQSPMKSVMRKVLPLWFGKRHPLGMLQLYGVLAMPPVRVTACLGPPSGYISFISCLLDEDKQVVGGQGKQMDSPPFTQS